MLCACCRLQAQTTPPTRVCALCALMHVSNNCLVFLHALLAVSQEILYLVSHPETYRQAHIHAEQARVEAQGQAAASASVSASTQP